MRRLKDDDEDDETGAAPSWNLSALVPALLLRPQGDFQQGDFQQALLGWEVSTSPLPDNKTELSADLWRSAAAKIHTSARYPYSFI